MNYPKRLIEVDLPIKRISEHARREKSIRHGHISTLHIWWARRPLAACRAVICAALWPDPADPNCPTAFRDKARIEMLKWTTHESQAMLSEVSRERFEKARQKPALFQDSVQLRGALLDFIADFANWDNSTVKAFLDTSRALTQTAHEALGGAPGTKPLVVDPFAGGGSIPLEALRVGADAFASDLNPVAVLLNKVVLEYIPKYGQRLADEVRKWGEWIKKEAEKELAEFYPKDPDGATPIAYLWARTIRCEGPGCGVEVPLIRSLWLAKKTNRSVALQPVPRPRVKRVDFRIIVKQRSGWVTQDDPKEKIAEPKFDGTVKRGSATCPCCGYTTPVARIREQMKARHGGLSDARLFAVVRLLKGSQGRNYRLPTQFDERAYAKAVAAAEKLKSDMVGTLTAIPNESTTEYHTFVNRGPIYGMIQWGDYFLHRQALAIATLGKLVRAAGDTLKKRAEKELATAVQTSLALCVDKIADLANGCCRWEPVAECPRQLFARQAIPMVWDLAEGVPIGESSGAFQIMVDRFVYVLKKAGSNWLVGRAEQASATRHLLPDDSANAFITDPPYYYSVQYADLADFFYVWLRRMLSEAHPDLFKGNLIPKEDEIIVQSPGHQFASDGKNNAFYEYHMKVAMREGRRVLSPDGVGLVVFAHTSTAGWEALLQAMLDAGWIISASWPIDTEMATRVIAQGRSVLASSVHLVCRPREDPDGSVRTDQVGDWRDVLAELPPRIHEWMPRLAEEGVVGADAIFACIGPALEIFSRYSRVEKASGEAVMLKEYLEQIWAAVAKEALTMIFTGADATGFEEDARLTAMWLWTLSAGNNGNRKSKSDGNEEELTEEEESAKSRKALNGYILEYDAARKIAQGLGAHLERLKTIVEIKAEVACLLPVSERTRYLFGKEESQAPFARRKKKDPQLKLGFMQENETMEDEGGWGEKSSPKAGSTTLDRLHQSMILFASGRSEALKRFLVDEGIGNDQRFWRLAQALSALYPKTSDEKRWVDGVLARKKGLGF